MGKKSKKMPVAPTPPVAQAAPASPAPTAPAPFRERHPTAANLIFAAVWIYVAALWLLALDQTFHWGIFDSKGPPLP